MRKIYCFFVLCAYVLGTIGGFGYLAWLHQWPVAIAVAALAAMAFPYASDRLKELLG